MAVLGPLGVAFVAFVGVLLTPARRRRRGDGAQRTVRLRHGDRLRGAGARCARIPLRGARLMADAPRAREAIEASWIDPADLSMALRDVMDERDRQRSPAGENYSLEHDDRHDKGELARAGAAYASAPAPGPLVISTRCGCSGRSIGPASRRQTIGASS